MDQFDQAQELDARYRQEAIDRHRRQSEQHKVSRENCIDCGDPIGEARKRAMPGCIRCIDCVVRFEQENGENLR